MFDSFWTNTRIRIEWWQKKAAFYFCNRKNGVYNGRMLFLPDYRHEGNLECLEMIV